MNTSPKTMITVLAAAAILSMGGAGTGAFAAQHHRSAEGNTYTYSEWYNTSEGQAQANVEGPNTCGCTGTVTRTWTGGGGQARKEVAYPTNGNTAVVLSYRRESDGTWRTYDYKILGVVDGASFDGFSFHYDVNGCVC